MKTFSIYIGIIMSLFTLYSCSNGNKNNSNESFKETPTNNAFIKANINFEDLFEVGNWILTIPKDPDFVGDKDRDVRLILYKDNKTKYFYLYNKDMDSEYVQRVFLNRNKNKYKMIVKDDSMTWYEIDDKGILYEHEDGYSEVLKAPGYFNESLVD